MTAPTAPAKPGTGNGKQQPVRPRPFVTGTRRVDKSTYDPGARPLTSSTQDLPVYECEPNGFLRGAYVYVQGTTSGNAATVAFTADGPFNVVDTITFSDTNNKPILGPMNGHDLYEAVKFGGYAFQDDMKSSPVYFATTGAGATGGSFAFVLPIPIEISRRDGLGSLVNKSSSATFDISIRLAASSAVYTTAPTTAPQVRVRIQQWGWMDPNPADMRGNPVSQTPPANNTTQFWQKQTATVNSGNFNMKLQGMDGLIRNFLFILTDNAGSRVVGDADFPDPFALQYETAQPINRLKDVWRHMIGESYGYTAAVETAGGRDYGVYPETYCYDFSESPGNESRFGYLPVTSATNVSLSGTIGGSGTHTLTVLTNRVVPANGDPMALTGR